MIQTLADALAAQGYETLTPVQEAVTDPALENADLLVSAQTGSGKTVAFGLAIAPTLLGDAPSFGRASAPLGQINNRSPATQRGHRSGGEQANIPLSPLTITASA